MLFQKWGNCKGRDLTMKSNVLFCRKNQAERCIKTAAKIISPVIENTFAVGYDW